MTAPTPHAPAAVRVTTVTAVVVVAAVAAVVSYSHMTELAHRAGEEWRSWLIPISVDGLIVAASMVLLTRHRAGLPGGWLAWGSLGVGVVASLAANMADARPEVTSVLVAGWAPVAFAATFHLLLQQRRADRAAPSISDPGPSEPGSGGLGRAGSDLTLYAPLDYSGGPAGRAVTVLPSPDGLDTVAPPSGLGPIDSPARPPSPGPDGLPVGRLVTGPLPAPVRPEVPVRPPGAGRPVATNGATTQARRRDKPRDETTTKPATRARQTKPATAEQRRAWVRQQRDNGRTPTGADVHKQFPAAPKDGARIVRQVDAELEVELRAVAAGER